MVQVRSPAQARHFGTHVLADGAAAPAGAAAEAPLVIPAAGTASRTGVLTLRGPLWSVLSTGRRVAMLPGIRILAPFPPLPASIAAAAVIRLALHPALPALPLADLRAAAAPSVMQLARATSDPLRDEYPTYTEVIVGFAEALLLMLIPICSCGRRDTTG